MAELLLLQQLQDEVPQLDLPGARGRLSLVGPVRKLIPFNVKRARCGSQELGSHVSVSLTSYSDAQDL